MEFMEGGTLTEASRAHLFTEKEIAYVAREMLKGIQFLHTKMLVHRDLKSSNVMMSITGEIKLSTAPPSVSPRPRALTSCSRFRSLLRRPRLPARQNGWVTLLDAARDDSASCLFPPGALALPPQRHWCLRRAASQIDIWSFAVCILELANRNPPNKSNPIKAMFCTATEGIPQPLDKPSHWGNTFKDFLSQCLMLDPEKRATAAQLLGHEFLKKAEEQKNMEKVLSSIFLHNTLAVLGTGFG